jgi:hypothetical protein
MRNTYQVEKDGKKYQLYHLHEEGEKYGRVMLCLGVCLYDKHKEAYK